MHAAAEGGLFKRETGGDMTEPLFACAVPSRRSTCVESGKEEPMRQIDFHQCIEFLIHPRVTFVANFRTHPSFSTRSYATAHSTHYKLKPTWPPLHMYTYTSRISITIRAPPSLPPQFCLSSSRFCGPPKPPFTKPTGKTAFVLHYTHAHRDHRFIINLASSGILLLVHGASLHLLILA